MAKKNFKSIMEGADTILDASKQNRINAVKSKDKEARKEATTEIRDARKTKRDARVDSRLESELDFLSPTDDKPQDLAIKTENPYDAEKRPDQHEKYADYQKLSAEKDKLSQAYASQSGEQRKDFDETTRKKARRSKRLQDLSLLASIPMAIDQYDNTGRVDWEGLPTSIIKRKRQELYKPYVEQSQRIKKYKDAATAANFQQQMKALDDMYDSASPSEREKIALEKEKLNQQSAAEKARGQSYKDKSKLEQAKFEADKKSAAEKKIVKSKTPYLDAIADYAGSEAIIKKVTESKDPEILARSILSKKGTINPDTGVFEFNDGESFDVNEYNQQAKKTATIKQLETELTDLEIKGDKLKNGETFDIMKSASKEKSLNTAAINAKKAEIAEAKGETAPTPTPNQTPKENNKVVKNPNEMFPDKE